MIDLSYVVWLQIVPGNMILYFPISLLSIYRSIQLNPISFQNHLRQAMAYRLLGNPCEAAR